MEVLTGYFDDSGSHAASEWYVVAGFVTPVSDWNIISDKWTNTLEQEGIAYFKMREAMAMGGQFKSGWTIPLRNQLIMKLVGIIEDANPPRIECFCVALNSTHLLLELLAGLLAPIRDRRRTLARDPGYVLQVVKRGTARAREITDATLRDVRAALGLFTLS